MVPIAFFVVGVIISEFILSRQIKKGAKLANYAALLCIEAAVLVGVAFIPFGNDWDMLANATVSFVASVQYSTFRKMENVPFATSFCTGNLRTATQYFYRGCAEKDVEKLFVGFKLAANIVCFAGRAWRRGISLRARFRFPRSPRADCFCCSAVILRRQNR